MLLAALLLGCGDSGSGTTVVPGPESSALLLDQRGRPQEKIAQRFSAEVMGGLFHIDLISYGPASGPTHQVRPLAEAAFAEARRVEELLSMWSPTSAVSLWNQRSRESDAGAIGMPVEVAELLARALELAAETGGAFDPTVGSALRELGFYGGAAAELTDANRAKWRSLVGYELIDIGSTFEAPVNRPSQEGDLAANSGPAQTELVQVTRNIDQVEFDLSSLAKGWATERMALVLQSGGITNAMISASSSSLLAFGPGPSDPGDPIGWPVHLPDPSAVEGELTWWLVDEALSTSGQSSITLPGKHKGKSHILDPRTLSPIEHRTEMVVVRGHDSVLCDMLSTALLVMGLDEARVWLAGESASTTQHDVMIYAVPLEGDKPEIVHLVR
jgi:thiamine biosynthesis lipoprotein